MAHVTRHHSSKTLGDAISRATFHKWAGSRTWHRIRVAERSDTSGAGLAFFFSEETGSKASTFATISLRPDLHVVVAKQQEQEGRKFMSPPPLVLFLSNINKGK